jgi:hypothetical protein
MPFQLFILLGLSKPVCSTLLPGCLQKGWSINKASGGKDLGGHTRRSGLQWHATGRVNGFVNCLKELNSGSDPQYC